MCTTSLWRRHIWNLPYTHTIFLKTRLWDEVGRQVCRHLSVLSIPDFRCHLLQPNLIPSGSPFASSTLWRYGRGIWTWRHAPSVGIIWWMNVFSVRPGMHRTNLRLTDAQWLGVHATMRSIYTVLLLGLIRGRCVHLTTRCGSSRDMGFDRGSNRYPTSWLRPHQQK